MTKPSHKSVKNHNREQAWYLLLTRWQLRWASLGGQLPYFQLAHRDYVARLKRAVETPSNAELFTAAELDQRQKDRLALLVEDSRPQESTDPTPSGWFRRWMRWSTRSKQHSSSIETQDSVKPASPLSVDALSSLRLFDRSERAQKMAPQLRALRRRFRRHHQTALVEFKQYQQIVQDLPVDDIDRDIAGLEKEYMHLGRVREWYGALAQLVSEVVAETSRRPADLVLNEDPTRLLQRDFLSTMQSNLVEYRRYNDLRREAFLLQDSASIRLLSYFKLKQLSADAFIDSPVPIVDLKQFLASLEYQIGLFKAKAAASGSETPVDAPSYIPYVDHEVRIENWRRFKQGSARDLNSLKVIAATCEDWQRDVMIFESELEVRRLENHGMSPVTEQSLIESFVREMIERIDSEIEVDVAFQQIISRLVRTGEEPALLSLTLEQLKLAQKKSNANVEVPAMKSEFVRLHRNLAEENAVVVPLFRR